MECAEIRRELVAGRNPVGPTLDAHLGECETCRELFAAQGRLGRSLAAAVLPEVEAEALFALVERRVGRDVGLRARIRSWPTWTRVNVWVGFAFLLFGWQLLVRRRADFAEYSAGLFWGVAALLGAASVLGAIRLLRGLHATLAAERNERRLAIASLIVPALALLIVPLGAGEAAGGTGWGAPVACLGYGSVLVVPLVLLYWLFERRELIPLPALIAAGGLAGIAANLLLHAHCASVHLGHLLLGHASVGAVWALALAFLGRPLQRAR